VRDRDPREPALRQAGRRELVFLVEDDPDIARLIRHHLETAAFAVRVFPSAVSVLAEALTQIPALFILDIMLPAGNGFELCRQIRENTAFSRTPVIFLTAKGAEADRVRGLELGGDDYIIKPFSPRELLARVRAVLRAINPELPTAPLQVGDLQIDPAAMTLKVSGHVIPTTTTEFRLLHFLAVHPGRVFTRDQLLDAVWSDTRYVTPRSVDVYVRRIREKIEPDPQNPRYLKTAHGVGYRFDLAR
jgi:two-component system phosphate regulon response regulator PhoB